MIKEETIMREVRWLEKEVDEMHYPTRSGFLHLIKEFKKRLEESQEDREEFEVYDCVSIKAKGKEENKNEKS